MKHFNQLSKILLIVVAIVGLAIGMSSVAGYNNSSDNVNTSIFAENDINNNLTDSKCGAGKCGGDDAKAQEAKCGTGKCG